MDDKEMTERQVLWVCGYRDEGIKPGSFTELMIQAIMKADYVNKDRLKQFYPELVAAVDDYMYGDLYKRYYEQRSVETHG